MRIDDRYDVIVVGGGPAGCYAAKMIAEQGIRVLVIEKDREIGVPVRCAEGVGHDGLTEFFEPDPRWTLQRIESFRFVAPNGIYVDVTPEQHGYLLDRSRFDAHIAVLAAEVGAQVVTRAMAIGLLKRDGKVDGVRLLHYGKEYVVRSRLVIGADGVESRVGRWAGLDTACSPHDMESCAQYLMTHIDIDTRYGALYFGKDIAPGGYAWVFPKGASIANVGLGISGDFGGERHALDYLDAFVHRYFSSGAVVRATAGGVPCSGGLKQIITDGVMLVGDAAHQVNPMSGAGIINALKAARIAGRVAAGAIRQDDVSSKRLAEYEVEWNRLLGRRHRSFYRIKESVFNLSDDQFNNIARDMNALAPEKRTLLRAFMIALKNQPKLLPELAKAFARELLH